MSPTGLKHDISDSEDDGDYVPPDGQESESDPSENEDNEAKETNVEPIRPETEEERKRARDALWSSFQESLGNPQAKSAHEKTARLKMVKVERKYLFAGEEVSEVIEVPEDSPEAKKWSMFQDPESKSITTAAFKVIASDAIENTPPRQGSSVELTQSESDAVNPATVPKPPTKRPGPRKSKISLAPLPGASKPKKLTTLDKSAMDWKSHLQAEEAAGSSITDELAANRRGGGYLEKVEFLKRVEERKDETLESLKSNKRRKL